MDCFFHTNVPSITRCGDCARPICATCRDATGLCPSCRLGARIDAAAASRAELPGGVRQGSSSSANPDAGTSARRYNERTTAVAVSTETRALVALGYPFWPLAALALLDPKRSPYIRRQAVQALGFTFGYGAFAMALTAVAHIPILGISAVPLLVMLVPIYIVASVVYGFKAWQGDDVRIPILSDWLDQRWPEDTHAAGTR